MFEELTKPFQSDEQSRFVLPVTRSEKDRIRKSIVQPKKSIHCFPLKTEKEASKVLKDSINTSHIYYTKRCGFCRREVLV